MKLLRAYDSAIFALIALLLIGLGYYSYVDKGDLRIVEIRSVAGVVVYPLLEDRELTLQGPLGETIVAIHDETVRVLSDPGPLQICVNAGAISRQGEWLACLPNQVLITIQGRQSGEVDIISK